MAYLVAKKVNKIGCIAIEMPIGEHLASYKRHLVSIIGVDKVQLITISRPAAYGEYEPYQFVDTESEFEEKVKLFAE